MSTRNDDAFVRTVLDLSNKNKSLLSKSQVNSRLLSPISNLINEALVLDILMIFQFLSYGNFVKGGTKTENKCILYDDMESDVVAFIKKIVRTCKIPLNDLEKNFNVVKGYLLTTLQNFMGAYGMFSASIPNVDNNASYGDIEPVGKTNEKGNRYTINGKCPVRMYYFVNTDVKYINCDAQKCCVHVPIINWTDSKYMELIKPQNCDDVVACFLLFFLIIFRSDVLGVKTEFPLQPTYLRMANAFTKRMQQSLARGPARGINMWATRRY